MKSVDKKNRQSSIVNRQSKAFTLVELMIVVAILGILAAIVLPEVQGYTQKAKEAAAKDNLRTLRQAIERYAAEHKDVAPGYQDDNPYGIPTQKTFSFSFMNNSDYFPIPPENPFNNSSYTILINNDQQFPSSATDQSGWIYKPSTKTIRLNNTGVDSKGIPYFEY